MKKIVLLLFATIVAGRVFASDTTITVCASSRCLTSEGITLTATVSPTFSGNIYWQKTIPGYSTWSSTILDTGNVFTVTDFPGSSGVYRAFIRANGINYFSEEVCLYKCNVVSLGSLTIITGGVTSDGNIFIKFEPKDFTKVNLQISTDNQVRWTQLMDVTGRNEYLSSGKLSGTLFFRLEGILSTGEKQYSMRPFKIKNELLKEINFQKRFDATITTISGATISINYGVTAANAYQAFKNLTAGLPLSSANYIVTCYQDGKRIPLRFGGSN